MVINPEQRRLTVLIDLEPDSRVVGSARLMDGSDSISFSGWTELMIAVDTLRAAEDGSTRRR
ncbi:MAG TPA: hypothetical protein VMU77_01610 [Acidimicrobiales bacterium]|nr:hypothetical protein [Acidimicrobiales bacterium]